MNDRTYCCAGCSTALDLGASATVGRKDECPKCRADLHACRNCLHFDPAAYNSCRESQAERVVDKTRSNFCDYFSFRLGAAAKPGTSGKAGAQPDPRAALEALFKK